MRADLWPIVQAGRLSLPIYATYSLDDIAEALALMRSNQHLGKIVISIG
jgi:NADPH:quinone reductase